MTNKLIVAIILCIIAIFFWFYSTEKSKFPVIYKICSLGYQDCQTIAKFKTRDDCETTRQKWEWYCDQTDKSNIKCQEEESYIASGFCD